MVVIGMNLVGQRVSAILRDRDVLSASLLRLLVLPVLTWVLLVFCQSPLVVGVIVIIMAMPCAAVTSILAESYGGNTEFPSKSVFLSSLFCLVTIPLISAAVKPGQGKSGPPARHTVFAKMTLDCPFVIRCSQGHFWCSLLSNIMWLPLFLLIHRSRTFHSQNPLH